MKKSYSFVTEITPQTEINLTGRTGGPLNMNIKSDGASTSVILDTDSITRLQAFLEDYLRLEEPTSTAPSYEPTGRALAVMDGRALDFVRVFKLEKTEGLEGCETDSYEDLVKKLNTVCDAELPEDAILIFFDLYEGSINIGVLKRIIRACIAYQVDYIRTGDVTKSRPMILDDIEAFTTIDISQISRAKRGVRILTPSNVFSLESNDSSQEIPSLFDEGVDCSGSRRCSRKEVLEVLKDYFASEDPRHPYSDKKVSIALNDMGYNVARRTVGKYRDLIGIPDSSERKVRK